MSVKDRTSVLYGGDLHAPRIDADAVLAALTLAESAIYAGPRRGKPLDALYQIAAVLNTATTVRKA